MTTQEIKVAGLRLFEATVVAMSNVANGCISDSKIVEENTARLVKMVSWFRDNDLMEDLKYFVYSGKFNRSGNHFYAKDLFERITK